jgi:enoyl-CoA hydratase/carnithine racemase
MPRNTIVFETKDHVARLTLNRPEAGNALDREMAGELEELCERVNHDDGIYVVILTGSGKDFCRGGGDDLEPGQYHPAEAVTRIDRPVIAAVNGEASGEGLELALGADIRLASADSLFSLPQVSRGRLPADGGTQRLPRIIGRGKALEMLLTAEPISAAEALEIGLVSRVVLPEALEEEAEKLAEAIAAKGPLALRYIKEAVVKGMDLTLEQGLRLEADLYFLLHTTADRTEGIKSFQEKRPPRFRGV